MKAPTITGWLAAALFWVLAAAPGRAQDDAATRARAKELFEQAVTDYGAARYDVALSGFQEAFRIKPHPMVRVNMANCYDKLSRPLEAIFHFEQFLDSDTGTAAQKKEVHAAVARLRKQVGELLLRVTPDGATVILDERDQRTSPVLEGVMLEAGKHSVEVRLSGYQSARKEFSLEGGGKLELNIALERETAPTPPLAAGEPSSDETPAPAPDDPVADEGAQSSDEEEAALTSEDVAAEGDGPPAAVWVVGAVTAGLIVAGTVTGILSLAAQTEFEQERNVKNDMRYTHEQRVHAHEKALAAADRANALALTTDILISGAILGALGTTILVVMHLREAPSTETASLTPILTPNTAALHLHASF